MPHLASPYRHLELCGIALRKKRCPGTAFCLQPWGWILYPPVKRRHGSGGYGIRPYDTMMKIFVATLLVYALGLLFTAVGSRLAGRCTTWCCALLGCPWGRGRHSGTVLPGAAAADAGISGGGHVGHGAGRRHRTGGRCHESGAGALRLPAAQEALRRGGPGTSFAVNACCCWPPAGCWRCLCGTAN